MRIAIFNDTAPFEQRTYSHFGCALVMDNLVHLLCERGLDPVWFSSASNDWRERPDLVPRDIDAVIVNGEGSIHDSATRWRPHALAAVGRFAQETLRVPSVLLNATIYRNDQSVYDDIHCFDAVFVRDTLSVKELAAHGIESEFAPDLSLADNRRPLARSGSGYGVCGTDSTLRNVTNAIAGLCRARGYQYLSIRNKPPRGLRKLIKPFRLKPRFDEFLTRHELAITGRFHALTVCLLTRTPFVAIESNTLKISALLDDVFGDRSRLIDLDEIGSVDLSRYDSWSTEELERIGQYCTLARERASAMTDKLVELFEEKGRTPQARPAYRNRQVHYAAG